MGRSHPRETIKETCLSRAMLAPPEYPGAIRTRCGRSIGFHDLRDHFDKPLAESARHFNTCTTFFKKMCRTFGIKRWPFRKVQSLRRRLESAKSVREWEAVNEKIQNIYTTAYWARNGADSDEDEGELSPNTSAEDRISFGTLGGVGQVTWVTLEASTPDQEVRAEGCREEEYVLDEVEQAVCLELSGMLRKRGVQLYT